MFAWFLVVFGLSAVTSSGLGGEPVPLQLGQGVTVTPADGWESAESVWEVGPNAVSLQRAGALVAFAADAYEGSAQQLLDDQLSDVRGQFASFRSLRPAPATVADGSPALKVLFTGTADSGTLEGELVVAATGQTGVVMLAVAPFGQIGRVQRDLDRMLDGLSIPR